MLRRGGRRHALLWEPGDTDVLIRPGPGEVRVSTAADALVRAVDRMAARGARRFAVVEPGLSRVGEAVFERVPSARVVAPGEDLAPARFDVVVAAHAFHPAPGREFDRGLAAAFGGLREGGLLALAVVAATRADLPAYLVRPTAARPGPERFVEATLQYRMVRAGLQGVRVRRYPEGDGAALAAFAVRRAFN